jgi:hypothetical protein
MWTIRNQDMKDAGGLRYGIDYNRQAATWADVLAGWQSDASFRSLFNSSLAESPYSVFRWETPAVTTATLSQPFAFVLLDSPSLARRPDPNAFAGHFTQTESGVVAFSNISGDALMIAPCPVADPAAYGHLAAFVRGAPLWQQDALWQLVGEAMARRMGTEPVWLSTAGAGVSWLHVRLDNRPKYYGYEPYRSYV